MKKQFKPETREELIAWMWNRGDPVEKIARRARCTKLAVDIRVRQLRRLGIPLIKRKSNRYDLDVLERRIDLERVRAFALAGKEEGDK